MASAALSGFCRVTVVAPTAHVDLAVAVSVPVVELPPKLLPLVGQEYEPRPGEPGAWALRRATGEPVAAWMSLAEAGVRDGDVLVLEPAGIQPPEMLLDDVVDALLEEDPRRSPLRHCQALAAGIAAGAIGLCIAGVLCCAGSLAQRGGTLIGVAAVLVVAAGVAGRVGRKDVTAFLSGLFGAASGVVGAAALAPGSWAGRVLAGSSALAGFAVLLPAVAGPPRWARAAWAGLAAFAVPLTVGGAVAAALNCPPGRAGMCGSAVAGPLALAMTTGLPACALRLARVPRPALAEFDQREEADERVCGSDSDVDAAQRTAASAAHLARALLAGLAAGSFAACAAAGTMLAALTDRPDTRALVLLLGGLAVARSRLFVAEVPVTAGVACGAAALAATAGSVLARGGATGVVATTACAAVVAVAALVTSGVARWSVDPRWYRLLEVFEVLGLAALVPLAVAPWGMYSAIARLLG